jgi:tRNA A-37 threonylcarbamoyl transferase component Bud32
MEPGPDTAFAARDFLGVEVASWLRRTQGRETFSSGPTAGSPAGCIVKRTSLPERGWMRPFRSRAARAAGRREHENLVALDRAGVLVPRAMGWASDDGGEHGPVSVVVMERIPHTGTLRDELEHADARLRRARSAELLDLVVRLHGQGFHHRDLYLQHFLVRAGDGALVLIDVGRVRRGRRARWLVKDLAALLHSTPEAVTSRDKLRFAAGWLDARGITRRGARRRFLRAVERKRARIAAHVPRDERGLPR